MRIRLVRLFFATIPFMAGFFFGTSGVLFASEIEAKGFVETCTFKDSVLEASGWAGSGDASKPVTKLILKLGTVELYNGPVSLSSRPDVASTMRGQGWLTSGWNISAPIPAELVGEGRDLFAFVEFGDAKTHQISVNPQISGGPNGVPAKKPNQTPWFLWVVLLALAAVVGIGILIRHFFIRRTDGAEVHRGGSVGSFLKIWKADLSAFFQTPIVLKRIKYTLWFFASAAISISLSGVYFVAHDTYSIVPVQTQKDVLAGELTAATIVRQEFFVPEGKFSELQILFATYARSNSANYTWKVGYVHEQKRVVWAERSVKGAKLSDNSYLKFKFGTVFLSPGDRAFFELISTDAKPGNAVTIWMSQKKPERFDGNLLINEQVQEGTLAFNYGIRQDESALAVAITIGIFVAILVFVFLLLTEKKRRLLWTWVRGVLTPKTDQLTDVRSGFEVNSRALLLLLVVSLGLIVSLSLFEIHYSSIALWDNYVQSAPGEKSTIFLGQVKGVRSDEWARTTPLQVAGYLDGGKNRQWSDILCPWNWGYYLGPVEFGYAFVSNFWLVFAIAGAFLMFYVLTKGQSLLSLVGSLLFLFSSFDRWWGLNSEIAMVSCIVGLALVFFNSRSRIVLLASSALIFVFLRAFVFWAYPAFQVPLGYLILIIFVSYIVSNWKRTKKDFLWVEKITLALLILAAIGVSMATWYFGNQDHIKAMVETVYPGQRVSTGGDLTLGLAFSGYFDVFLNHGRFFPGSNICESSSFILIFPIMAFLWFVNRSKQPGSAGVIVSLLCYMSFLVFYVVVGIPELLAKTTLFSYVPGNRAIIGLGYANIIFFVLTLSRLMEKKTDGDKLSPKKRISEYGALVIFIVFIIYVGTSVKIFSAVEIVIVILEFLVFGIALLRRSVRFIIVSLGFLVLVPSIGTNPIAIGLDSLLDRKINHYISDIVKVDKSRWLVFGEFLLPQFFTISGADFVNRADFPPNLKDLRTISNGRESEEKFNRFAMYRYVPKIGGDAQMTLVQGDLLEVKIDPLDPALKTIGVGYFVFKANEDIDFEYLERNGLVRITSEPLNGFVIYKRRE